MKKLFAVLLAVAMLLSLGVAAFAANDSGKITILDTPENSVYYAIKIFDAVENGDKTVKYTIDGSKTGATYNNKVFSLLFDSTGKIKSPFSGLKAVKNDNDDIWTVTKLTGFDAAEFAKQLRTAMIEASGETAGTVKADYQTGGTPNTAYALGSDAQISGLAGGYYFVVSAVDADFTTNNTTTFPDTMSDFKPAEDKLVLTTVLPDKEVKVQNKNDMPLDKQVDNADTDTNYDDNGEGVNVGDTLSYQITSNVPHTTAGVYESTFVIRDQMTEGLTFDNKLHIKIDGVDANAPAKEIWVKYIPATGNTASTQAKLEYYTNGQYSTTTNNPALELELITDPDAILKGNQIRFNTDGNTFELSLDVASKTMKAYEGKKITVEYTATVNEAAVATILKNTAVLTWGEGNDINVRDAETDNYTSQIIIDKFETGNRSQKLAGAEFVLFKDAKDKTDPATTSKYYQLKAKTPDLDGDGKVQYNDDGSVKYKAAAEVISYAVFTQDDAGNTHLAYTDTSLAPLYYNATSKAVSSVATGNKPLYLADPKVEWIDAGQATNNYVPDGATKVRTAGDGSAVFAYLADNETTQSYYLQEVKAPVDYTQLLNPVEVRVNGEASMDPTLTEQQRVDALTEVVNVANTPGSSLPSTGGVGATLMTIGGVALILAAGAFLVLRRRKEQE